MGTRTKEIVIGALSRGNCSKHQAKMSQVKIGPKIKTDRVFKEKVFSPILVIGGEIL